MICKGFN
ncbi:hypothetical protein LINGRAHAP2_LOCUS6240 [Linum grandiflorum]